MESNIKLTKECPVRDANIFSRLTFAWLLGICKKCWKKGLEVCDLYENMPADKSEKLCNLLERNWNIELEMKNEKNKKPSLLRAIRKTFFLPYMLSGLLLFFDYSILRPIRPMLLSIFIGLFSRNNDAENKAVSNEMYLYGGLMVAISFVLLFFQQHVPLQLSRIGMRIRIACCSLIYRKVLRLSQHSLGKSATGQVVNLLSNDVTRFDILAPFLHHIWMMPIQATIITYLIWREVQMAAFVGVGCLTIMTVPVHAYLGKISSSLRLRIALKTDIRVKKMSEIISGIQVIKLYAWEKPFSKIVNTARLEEIAIVTWTSYVRGILLASFVFIERTILAITVITYVLFGNVITADKLFSIAQCFNLLQLTMGIYYPLASSVGAETLVTIKRLEEFLLQEERGISSITKANSTSKSVVLENVDASWVPKQQVFTGININVAPGSLCAIVGPVGAGKTSVFQLLLGELVPDHGRLNIGGEISYSSQDPWIFSSTIRNNILFGQKYERARYRLVLKLCALERDIQLLPYGDKTLVGDKGTTLSGGQKARINLARAVYRNADIYLLDDPLSAVDINVGHHLFEECIVGYLKDKTRILITHQLQYLKKADHIVVINNGAIEAQGSFNELTKSNLDFTKMLKSSAEYSETEDNPNVMLTNSSQTRKDSILSSFSGKTEKSIRGDSVQYTEEIRIKSQQSAYWAYARAGGGVCVLFGLLFFMVLAQVASNAGDLWITHWAKQETIRSMCENSTNSNSLSEAVNIELMDGKDYNHDPLFYQIQHDLQPNETKVACDDLIDRDFNIYVYIGLILACTSLLILRSFYFFKVAMNSSKNLHNRMFYSLLQAPMRFFDTNPSGRILNRFTRDMGMIDELLSRLMLEALQIFFVMIGILVMVFISNLYMIVIAVILAILFYKLRGWYVCVAENVKHLEGITRSPVFSHVNASLNGITTIRAAHAQGILMREFDLHQDTHTSAWYMMLACTSAFGLWLDFLSFIFVTCVTFGFVIMNMFGAVDGSLVGLAITQSLILTGMVQYGMKQAAEVVSQMTSVERVLEYTTLEKEGPLETNKDLLPDQMYLGSWPSKGIIKFQQVYLTYSKFDEPVLKNLTFSVKSNEKIGIVGRTGAGKSSIIAALFRLVPSDGLITIDKLRIDIIGLNDLRKRISIIPQEPVLFSATLRYNLDPFAEFPDQELWNALETVELKDMVDSLDFVVEDSGKNFSVGQRQLICLARAVLRKNKILVLDEATANVDPQTDALIQQTIRHKFSKCTVLTIAHRLHSVMDSDKVLVMDEGKLMEFDHPHQLLANSNGYLFKMVAQTGSKMAAQLHKLAEKAFLKNVEENSYL